MPDVETPDRLRQLEVENARLRHLLDQQGVPAALRHQVRNALGLMRAIVRRSTESKTTVEDFAAHLEGRFDALLRVQTMLIASPDAKADLFALVSNELMAYTIQEDGHTKINGPEVRVDAKRAELLGIVIHELVTNALKFGAFATAEGRLDLTWHLEADASRLVLVWSETGSPPSETHLAVRGFGTEAIEGMLPYQLKAESRLEFLPQGLRCTIALPLSEPVRE